jgi:hypothetical protein
MSYEDNTCDAMDVESCDEFEDSEDEFMEMVPLLLIMRRKRKRKHKKKKITRRNARFWVRKIFQFREEYGEYHRLIQELREGDRENFFR